MPKEVEHPQVTEAQVEMWLANPVTKAFIACLNWKRKDTRDQAGDGSIVDSSNADLTHGLLHRALGQQDGFRDAADPEDLLEHYEMIFHPPPPEEEKPDA